MPHRARAIPAPGFHHRVCLGAPLCSLGMKAGVVNRTVLQALARLRVTHDTFTAPAIFHRRPDAGR